MRLPVILHLAGVMVRLFSAAFLAPLAVALSYRELYDGAGFVAAGGAAFVVGHYLRRASGEPGDLRRVEGMAVVAGTWLLVAVFSAVPYVWVGVPVVDALFEAMSGITTTGATTFQDFSRYGQGTFFWRALTQWLGGLGVIALFVAILPRLAIGGRQLFFAEAPGPTDEKLTPQIRKTAAALWLLYLALTLAETGALRWAGMPWYDAACHALTTMAAGGFSPHPQSIMGYANPAVEWVVIGFMFLAGASFALQVRALRGRPLLFFRDDEMRAYFGLIVVFSGLAAVYLWRHEGLQTVDAIRTGLFQVISVLTTTGYASMDFGAWTDQGAVLLLALMFVGGCAGSAAGGPKVVRHLLMARYTLRELTRALHPRAVLPVKLGRRTVPDDVMRAVLVFFLFYLLVFAACAFVLAGLGADLVTALSASISALSNVGPAFGEIGPMAHFAHLPAVSKLTLAATMWIGRLEVLTVLVLLRPEVWTTARWQREENAPTLGAAPSP